MYDSKYNTSYTFLCKSDCGITYLVFAGWVKGINNRSSGYPTRKYMKGGTLNNSIEKLTEKEWKWITRDAMVIA